MERFNISFYYTFSLVIMSRIGQIRLIYCTYEALNDIPISVSGF
jgi:hypothetical protein